MRWRKKPQTLAQIRANDNGRASIEYHDKTLHPYSERNLFSHLINSSIPINTSHLPVTAECSTPHLIASFLFPLFFLPTQAPFLAPRRLFTIFDIFPFRQIVLYHGRKLERGHLSRSNADVILSSTLYWVNRLIF